MLTDLTIAAPLSLLLAAGVGVGIYAAGVVADWVWAQLEGER